MLPTCGRIPATRRDTVPIHRPNSIGTSRSGFDTEEGPATFRDTAGTFPNIPLI
jgi:hypothetical protein